MPDDLLQNFAILNQKLDSFMQLYERRHDDLEKRIDRLEERADTIDAKINGLHNSSMQWVNDALAKQTEALNASTQGLERRILDKIDGNSKFSMSNWVIIGFGIVSSLIGIGGVIVAIVK